VGHEGRDLHNCASTKGTKKSLLGFLNQVPGPDGTQVPNTPAARVFEWAEQTAASFILDRSRNFSRCLSELPWDRWPDCSTLLDNLVGQLLTDISGAFPIFSEHSTRQRVQGSVHYAATRAQRRRGACMRFEEIHGLMQTSAKSNMFHVACFPMKKKP